MLQAAVLLTADCLGTGLLALPQDVKVLGKVIGLGFLILNLPINLYAGTILHQAAQYIEEDEPSNNDAGVSDDSQDDVDQPTTTTVGRDGLVRVSKGRKAYSSIASSDTTSNITITESESISTDKDNGATSNAVSSTKAVDTDTAGDDHPHHDSSTFDYIGLTHELFPSNKHAFRSVLWFYYNIFLVLGE